MALINTTTTGILGTTVYGDGSGDLTVQRDGVTINKVTSAPAFSAYLASSQSVSTSTFTKYAAATERFDTNSCYDTTNYRFTPNVAGYYFVKVANWFATGTSGVSAAIYKNGSSLHQEYDYQSGGLTARCESLVYLNGTTDYIEAYFFQSTGSTQSLDSSSQNPGFQAFLVRAI
jgi:hypothetical protein